MHRPQIEVEAGQGEGGLFGLTKTGMTQFSHLPIEEVFDSFVIDDNNVLFSME